ncbi:acyl-CoA dehydrogenase family protein [Altererythrobacter sp.]|uniref:acyl-CoA dehydrogenase family protein n=1 Tax=Altererythrobacter sp. TaxID=1872480 RepID=UPI001B0703CF|nr:acyl-CoA dehydrogenase family protein [Altererythrobacter sp.]MBO6609064.1 acyl-CoA/acyl-ACP dehydrogenase [Altererythrobacter sp.]MBO6642603.1 acyl-CoA/acyl-ACP dehydrogenase [Altererythrobacter sp.]MBO6708889.1 acyl-CoA/acyl-ACP dehydrogenase [Altererythrobacter sp.]MBO6945002.1 acyl-CoA/acyl-ACP dehydrogenase [Altererythrobacter sp.]
MPLYHNEDQAMLAETASQFMAEEGSIAKQLRHWRDRDCKDGFGHALWKEMAELGFTGILVSEEDGGLGMGHVEAGIVLEEIGRNLTPSPFLTSSVLAATALSEASDELRGRYLPGLVAGESVFAVAIDEGAKHRPERIACKAEKSGNGFKLSGKKDFVVQGASSDMIIVAARTSGSDTDEDGITLFAVPMDAAGMSHDAVRLVDSSMATHTTFDNVELDGDAVIGEVDGGREVLNKILNAGRVGSAAEGVGVARGAMDMTVDYLKQRKQFGKLIGEFQALQHRAAHLYSEVEIARAAVIKAQQLLDGGSEKADLMVSVAKAKVAKTAGLAVREGVQMHGGIGMTDEYDIGLYMKRDRALQEFLGDAYYHTNRVAELSGY